MFHGDGGYLAVFPRGYVLTLFVGDSERCDPAEYLTLRRLDDDVFLELMIPTSATQGKETLLQGAELDRFLGRVGISRVGVEDALRRRFAELIPGSGG